MNKTLLLKYTNLKKIISKYKKVIVAFSGGIDSTLLLKVAISVLGTDNIIAVIAKSEIFPDKELNPALKILKKYKINYFKITTDEMKNENFLKNDKFRCYYCKLNLFSKIDDIRIKNKFNYTLEGSNLDDTKDYRPGLKAIKELKIKSPLIESKFTKQDIRNLAKQLKIKIWDKPSFACLSSRIPYGTRITSEEISKIEKAENYLSKLNIKQLRVRSYKNTARIEVLKKDFNKILDNSEKINKYFNKLGYLYVSLDLNGYKTGSMNKII